jgi:hypothetical protein
MKTKLVLGAIAAAVAVFSQGAFAQAASSPTRAEVKAEAKSGAAAPVGEKPSAQPSTMSDKSRADRKATTKADKASGNLKATGEAETVKDDATKKRLVGAAFLCPRRPAQPLAARAARASRTATSDVPSLSSWNSSLALRSLVSVA